MEEALKRDEVEEKAEAEEKKKIEKTSFLKRLSPYNRPLINNFTGIVAACVQGCIMPTFGILITKMLFSLMLAEKDKELMKTTAREWCLYMFLAALTALVMVFTQRFSFGVIGENITKNIRWKLYLEILKKNVGWFDHRDNAPGVLTGVLASEVQTLNGVSTEGLAVVIETFFALACGITLGFVFNWKVSLVALGCIPLMIVGGSINAKF